MITFQYFTSNDAHQYGNNTILRETEPYLTRPVRIPVRRTKALLYSLRIINQCRQRDGPVVHHFTEPSMGFMGHIPTKGKKIISINDAIEPKWYPLTMKGRILHAGYHKFDAIITISESAKEEISKVYHIPEEMIFVAPPGVNCTKFHPTQAHLRDIYKIPECALVFGTVGNTRRHKNLAFGQEVLKYLHEHGEPDAYFIRCGYYDEGDKHQVEGMHSINGGYSKNFINLPYQEDLVAYFGTLNAYFAPSLEEGFDLPVLEAMACGKPVVASDISVHQEILGDNAVLVKMDSPEQAGACALLLRTMHYFCLSQEVQEFACQHTWEQTASRMQEIYDTVAES